MAARRRSASGRFVKGSSRRRAAATNPRRRRRHSRRRNPGPVALLMNPHRRRRAGAKRTRRHHRRRSNPSSIRIGQIFKDMVYGTGGAILTRVGASAVRGFVPASFSATPLTGPILQALVAVFGVRWVGRKFLGQAQADIMMLGGLLSAGLEAADTYFPGFQSGLSNIIRAPVGLAPGLSPQAQAAVAQGAAQGAAEAMAGMGLYSDVEEVPNDIFGSSVFSGLGDVEEVPLGIWPGN